MFKIYNNYSYFWLMKRGVILFGGALSLAGCAMFNATQDPNQCNGTATYKAQFNSIWSPETHQTDFPNDAHYSNLIGATHGEDVVFWSVGNVASAGIKDIAEKGVNRKFIKEVNWAIKIDNASSLIQGSDLKGSSGQIEVEFQVDNEFSLLTLITMIAPSPDWFLGVSGLDMCENGTWIQTKFIELKGYDAGTDSGTTYTATDEVTDPKAPISILDSGVFNDKAASQSLATLKLMLTATDL